MDATRHLIRRHMRNNEYAGLLRYLLTPRWEIEVRLRPDWEIYLPKPRRRRRRHRRRRQLRRGAHEAAPLSLFFCALVYLCRFVGIQDAFEVIHLVLKDVCE